MLQMILDEVKAVRESQDKLRDKIDESSKDTRKYVDTRVRELDDRIKEREKSEITSLKEANTSQDKTISDLKSKVEALSKWSEGVKAKAAVVLTIVTFVGASAGGLLAKFIPG